MNQFLKVVVVLVALSFSFSFLYSGTMTEVNNFGADPGNLRMFKYVPDNMPSNAPLVVAIHGCSQTANTFEYDTEWNKLADLYKFYVVYPDQQIINNGVSCFNWFLLDDIKRDFGEAKSIKSMVEHMQNNYSINEEETFVTGFSAGGSMTAVLCAVYPDVFEAGAIIAGTPYKSATNFLEAAALFSGVSTNKNPVTWGNLVRNAYPSFSENYPKMMLMQGTNDIVVNSDMMNELMEQWTDVHSTNQIPDSILFNYSDNENVSKSIYKNANGEVVVEAYLMQTLLHAIPVNPGNCFDKGGQVNLFAQNFNFYSSYYVAKFFGLIPEFKITYENSCIDVYATNQLFSVPEIEGNTYFWELPQDVTLVLDNDAMISVDWGTTSGLITATEVIHDGCQRSAELMLDICDLPTSSHSSLISNLELSIIYNKDAVILYSETKNASLNLNIYNASGQLVSSKQINSFPYQINSSSLAKGIYFVMIEENGQYFSEKIIVSN